MKLKNLIFNVMAGIDKIYLSDLEQAKEFIQWCMEHDKSCYKTTKNRLVDHLYYELDELPKILLPDQRLPVSNFPIVCDKYIAKNCKFPYILDALKTQYGDFEALVNEDYLPFNIDYPEVVKFKFYDFTSGFRFGNTCNLGIGYSYRIDSSHGRYWWYDKSIKQWADPDLQMIDYSTVSSNASGFRSLKALKRHIRTLRLPLGTELIISGRYIGETYRARITKVK